MSAAEKQACDGTHWLDGPCVRGDASNTSTSDEPDDVPKTMTGIATEGSDVLMDPGEGRNLVF
jgi:hypothetical protein